MHFSEGKIIYWGTTKNVCRHLKEIALVLENNYTERTGRWRMVLCKISGWPWSQKVLSYLWWGKKGLQGGISIASMVSNDLSWNTVSYSRNQTCRDIEQYKRSPRRDRSMIKGQIIWCVLRNSESTTYQFVKVKVKGWFNCSL